MAVTVAIVDDNPLNVESLALLVRNMGISTVVFDTPDALIESLDTLDHLDVVFLDLEFPNQNGLKAIQWMKRAQPLQDVPFVAYTVHTSEQNEARDAGFHSFLGKPLNVVKFPEQMRRILNGEHVWEIG